MGVGSKNRILGRTQHVSCQTASVMHVLDTAWRSLSCYDCNLKEISAKKYGNFRNLYLHILYLKVLPSLPPTQKYILLTLLISFPGKV